MLIVIKAKDYKIDDYWFPIFGVFLQELSLTSSSTNVSFLPSLLLYKMGAKAHEIKCYTTLQRNYECLLLMRIWEIRMRIWEIRNMTAGAYLKSLARSLESHFFTSALLIHWHATLFIFASLLEISLGLYRESPWLWPYIRCWYLFNYLLCITAYKEWGRQRLRMNREKISNGKR